MASDFTPMIKLPMSFNGMSMDVVAQGSEQEIGQSVQVILQLEQGSLSSQPELGYIDQAFVERFDENLLAQTISDQEPRANFSITSRPSTNYPGKFDVQVRMASSG